MTPPTPKPYSRRSQVRKPAPFTLFDPTPYLRQIRSIPTRQPSAQLQNEMLAICAALHSFPVVSRPALDAAISSLASKKNAVVALYHHYNALPSKDYPRRLQALRILGSLRRLDALAPLKAAAWAPLPPPSPTSPKCDSKPSDREQEEMLQAKAAQGIGYLRARQSYAELERLMTKHESLFVRIAAIDSYLWNKDYSPESTSRIAGMLPSEMHKYVYRPRYRSNMNAAHFNARLQAWLTKWGQSHGRL